MPLGTIRLRLTLWYVVALVIILTGSGVFWYSYLSRSLLHTLDERLKDVARELTAFHVADHTVRPADHINEQLDFFIHRYTQGERVQILDIHGEICCHSENIYEASGHLPLSQQALRKAQEGEPWYSNAMVNGEELRVLSWPDKNQDLLKSIILVAAPTEPITVLLHNLLGMIIISSPLAVLALLWAGWFLSGRALTPIKRMGRAIQNIDVNKLNSRLPLPERTDEITQLGTTFNALLDRLQQAFNQIRQFTADASHELRTPLAILRGETEVTLAWGKTSEDYRRTLESNLEEIDRMGRIIEDLLTLSRSEAGQAPLNLTRFSLYELLQGLYEQGMIYGEPRNVRINLKANIEHDIEILADQPRLHQALLNLITNAIKYSDKNSTVDLDFELLDDEIVIEVRDYGIGIEERHLPFIFDRFYRVDSARDRDAGGAGIGLAITHWIVSAHHGRIEVVSKPGEGSTFTVRLPKALPTN